MIKLIATDMDGTWLTDEKTYDEELFLREFKIMQERDIKFVVASGNQYENLVTRFPQVVDQLYFIAENGALVAKGKQVIHVDNLSTTDWQTLLGLTHEYDEKATVSGLLGAYILAKDGPEYAKELAKYYEKLTVVSDFDHLEDKIFKVTFDVAANKLPDMLAELKQKHPELGFVAGSAESIDMSTKGMNKAVGLEYLSKKLGINPKEMVAFGDSGNDVGMLKYAGRSFATSTALPSAKQAADQIIGSSNDSAVQKEIWKLLKD
ncbi:HAD family hydrolase [Lactobacillus sp. ESL0681]|uniref:Cof-type HAD-IIB family hydrolase n=1 Tax=Lactobacillus sp. ESL0681 TaxID=2983211 RepID=UPI0023F85472|nr:HAD family hydrolase [Lactobacillus sp. ESL0681]WEV40702.1 HAD family hydrolase [Lactobacillus sp. ESL0681]